MSARKANSNGFSYHSWTTSSYSLPLKLLLLSSLTLLLLGVVLGNVEEIANAANSASRAAADSKLEEQALLAGGKGKPDLSPINPRPRKDEVILRGDENKLQGPPSHVAKRPSKIKIYLARLEKAFDKLWEWVLKVLRIRPRKSGYTALKDGHSLHGELEYRDQEKYIKIPKTYLAPMEYPGIQLSRTKKFIVNDEHNVYRALAHLEYQDQEKYALVKYEIEKYIRKNPLQFKHYRIKELGRKEVYPHIISVGGVKYGKMNEAGTRGVIFSAFSRLKQRRFSVLTKTAHKPEANPLPYDGFHYLRDGMHDGAIGLVVEDGHYEVYGPPGSKILETIHPQASKTPNEHMYTALQHQDQEKYADISQHHLAPLEYHNLQLLQTQDFIVKDEKNVYRALAHLKYQDQEKYALVEKEIKQYIKSNPSEFGKYQIEGFEHPVAYPHKISVGKAKYGELDHLGVGGVIFDAFSRLNKNKFSVLRYTAAKYEGDSPYYTGFRYMNEGNNKRPVIGLVVDNGNYEVFGPPGSKILKTQNPKANDQIPDPKSSPPKHR